MNISPVARKYAKALFDVAEHNQRVAGVSRDLTGFVTLLKSTPDLQAVFDSPSVPSRKKRAIVDALFAASDTPVSAEVQRLVEMLADHDRLGAIEAVATAYEAQVMDAERALPAEVVTVVTLDDGRRQALADALGRATGRRVTVEGRVDPTILGGVVAKVGSLVFDGSVAGQLERMRQRLSSNI